MPASARTSTAITFQASSLDMPVPRSPLNRVARSCVAMRIRPNTSLQYHFDHSLVGEKTDNDCIREQWSERESGRRKTRQERGAAGQHPETNQHRAGQAGTGV